MRYCGRNFTERELELIRQMMLDQPTLNRAQLSRLVCQKFQWLKQNGGLKEMSCRVAMLRMQSDGLIQLPVSRKKRKDNKRVIIFTSRTDERSLMIEPVHSLGPVQLKMVKERIDSSLWNEYIERYHYLGFTTLPGAQIRYFAYCGDMLVALLGWSAAAWKTTPRDKFIGWDNEQRQKNLNYIVNNSRFLILPWIRSPNLASKLLALSSKQLSIDWIVRYGYQPVLLETFVESQRFVGGCYKAANWINVGQTKGRGKLDIYHKAELPEKSIWLYPLHKLFRKILCQ